MSADLPSFMFSKTKGNSVEISDSDSDDDTPVVVTSKARSCRGLASRLKSKSRDNVENQPIIENAIYTKRVVTCFGSGSLHSVKLSADLLRDVEDDAPAEPDIPGKRKCNKQKQQAKGPECLTLSSDEEESFNISPTKLGFDMKSPTPPRPPSPPKYQEVPVGRKRPRMAKAVKNAIRTLSETKTSLQINEIRQNIESFADQYASHLDQDEEKNANMITVRIKHITDTYRFHISKKELFKKMMGEMAKNLQCQEKQILLVLNHQTIHASDTPSSLNLSSADIIDCYVSDLNTNTEVSSEVSYKNKITVLLQSKYVRQKMEFSIDKTKPLGHLLRLYSVQKDIAVDKLKLVFDGEDILPSDSADDLEIEDGFCLDILHLQ